MITLRSTYLSCAFFALSAGAFCTPVLYVDRTAWLNDTPGSTNIGFENAVGNYSTTDGFTTGLPLGPTFFGDVTVNGTSGYNLLILDPALSPYFNFDSGASLWWSSFGGPISASYLHITFPTPITAFAADLMTYGGNGVSYSVKLNNDSDQVYTSDATTGWPTRTFFGLTSPTPISTIDFYLPNGSTPLIDNFAYYPSAQESETPGETPELCTFLLIASGLIGMAVIGKRMRRPEPQII